MSQYCVHCKHYAECLQTGKYYRVKGLGCEDYDEKKTSFTIHTGDQWFQCAFFGNAILLDDKNGVECPKGTWRADRIQELRTCCETCPIRRIREPVRWTLHTRPNITINIHGKDVPQ